MAVRIRNAANRRPPQFQRSAFVYILRCADGTFYTGYAVNLERRFKEHQSGNGARYTRTRTPVQLVYSEPFKTRHEAMRREAAIKRLPRAKKLALINADATGKPTAKGHKSR